MTDPAVPKPVYLISTSVIGNSASIYFTARDASTKAREIARKNPGVTVHVLKTVWFGSVTFPDLPIVLGEIVPEQPPAQPAAPKPGAPILGEAP